MTRIPPKELSLPEASYKENVLENYAAFVQLGGAFPTGLVGTMNSWKS
jgi:hypothetical protein